MYMLSHKFRLPFHLPVIASIDCPLDTTIIISEDRTSFQKLPPPDLSEVMPVKNYLDT